MRVTPVKSELKKAILLGAACFLAYSGCYMGRNILSSMLPQMIANQVYGRDPLAMMGSIFFITYGAGQLINGLIGNKISGKYMVFFGLFLSGVLCLVFPLLSSETLSLILWGVCGFLCSMLWGPLSKLVGENTTASVGRILLTLLTVASIAGTAVTYFLAVFSAVKNQWKIGFFAIGTILIVLSVLWFAANIFMEKKGMVRKIVEPDKPAANGGIVVRLLQNGFVAITLVAMLNGVIRNAVAFWIPTFISERFQVSTASAAAISSILPFVNLAGTLLSVYLAKYLHNNETKMLVILFVFTTLMFTIMYFLNGRGMVLNLIALFSASAAMTGACNMIFSFYVLRFADSGQISGITGFLDFASYVAASAASAVFSSLVPGYGWNFVVAIWAAVTLAGIFFSWVSMRTAKRRIAADAS